MRITLNGDEHQTQASSIAELLGELALSSSRVAVELNQAIVRRSEHAATALQPEDRVEIVTLVGGG